MLLFTGLLGAHAMAADTVPYPNTSAMGIDHPETEAWYKQCVQVAKVMPPAADVGAAAPADCNAEDLYYDTRSLPAASQADWQNVRACAIAKKNGKVLMMLYANGFGVAKNSPLAVKYACSIAAAPAEMSGRIEHLNDIARKGGKEAFDLCDDITSGAMMGYCQQISERQAAKARGHQVNSVAKTLPPAQQAALSEVQKALQVFADGRGRDETDLSGTARAAMSIAATSAELDVFAKDLQKFEQGNTPRYSSAGFADADKKLNDAYRKVMNAKDGGGFGTVTKDGIRNTQRAWLKYRDAMVKFGVLKYPKVAADSWKTLLTERRTQQLDALVSQ
ncbi:lysozyme inhibitor LprI family protein [Janthinobacterium agaricidamnosum]|nr:lysozyme inhibitor LprI family protein [Janthinobacterium agaricidamnosum]